jgi:hypothetical protein
VEAAARLALVIPQYMGIAEQAVAASNGWMEITMLAAAVPGEMTTPQPPQALLVAGVWGIRGIRVTTPARLAQQILVAVAAVALEAAARAARALL